MTPAQAQKLYVRLPTTCSLCVVALEECAMRLKPRREYKLYVGRALWTCAIITLRHIGALVRDNPFAPYINLVDYDRLQPHEWFLEGDAGEAFGSEGI